MKLRLQKINTVILPRAMRNIFNQIPFTLDVRCAVSGQQEYPATAPGTAVKSNELSPEKSKCKSRVVVMCEGNHRDVSRCC
jgi:hypothetical protein